MIYFDGDVNFKSPDDSTKDKRELKLAQSSKYQELYSLYGVSVSTYRSNTRFDDYSAKHHVV